MVGIFVLIISTKWEKVLCLTEQEGTERNFRKCLHSVQATFSVQYFWKYVRMFLIKFQKIHVFGKCHVWSKDSVELLQVCHSLLSPFPKMFLAYWKINFIFWLIFSLLSVILLFNNHLICSCLVKDWKYYSALTLLNYYHRFTYYFGGVIKCIFVNFYHEFLLIIFFSNFSVYVLSRDQLFMFYLNPLLHNPGFCCLVKFWQLTELKAFADNKFYVVKMMISDLDWVKNSLGKG